MSLLNEEQAERNHSQSLDRLNDRGGLSPMEIIANIEKMTFRELSNHHSLYDDEYYINKLLSYL